MKEKPIKVTYEKLSMDNLAAVFLLWEEFIKGSDRAYEKYSEFHRKVFLSHLAYSIDNPKFIGRVVKKGRKVIGFILGEIRLRKSEPMHVFHMEHYFVDKDFRGKGVFKKLLEDIKLDFRIMGVTHIEIEDFSEETKEIKGFNKSKTVHIMEV